jgi:hypothetical protein
MTKQQVTEIKNQILPRLSHLRCGNKVPSHPLAGTRPSVTSDELDAVVVVRRTNSARNTTAINTASNSAIAIDDTGKVRLRSTTLLSKVQGRCDGGRSQSKSVPSSAADLHNHMLIGLINDKLGGISGVRDQFTLATVAGDEDVFAVGAGS